MKTYRKELKIALEATKAAQKIILDIYKSEDFKTEIKEDNSPVTQADLKANEIICNILKENFKEYGILSEELADDKERLNKEYLWIIDPIDGTKDFIAKTDEFTVNIGLIYKHEVVLGVIGVPAKGEIYYAIKGQGSYLLKNDKVERIFTDKKDDNLIQMHSRFHFSKSEEEYFNAHDEIIELKGAGSAYKACLIACGKTHIYLKNSKGTKEWDVAPSAIVIKEAGGFFGLPNGEEMQFNRENVYNDEGFIILNKYNKKLLINK